MQLKDFVQVQSVAGQPVTHGGITVTPQAQTIRINGFNGRWFWVRPTSVLVEQDGSQERIPIVDVTIVALMAIAVLTFIFSLGSRLRRNRRNENA